VTGSMALIAPARRDTRPSEQRAGDGFGPWSAPALDAACLRSARQGANAALARVSAGNAVNPLGLTREMSVGAVAAVAAFLWWHSADLGNPAALAKALDPAPVRTLFAMLGQGGQCMRQGLPYAYGLSSRLPDCSEMTKAFAEHRDDGGLVGYVARGMSAPFQGMYRWPDGSIRSTPPPDVRIAKVRAERCFLLSDYSV